MTEKVTITIRKLANSFSTHAEHTNGDRTYVVWAEQLKHTTELPTKEQLTALIS